MLKKLYEHFKRNKLYFIVYGLSIVIVSIYFAYISRYNCFWGDDFWYGRYKPNEGIFDCLKFNDHGEGYFGYFIFKFLVMKLPLLLGLHPIDFIGVPHGAIKGIFFSIIVFSISQFINFYKNDKKTSIVYSIFLLAYMLVLITIENISFVMGNYKFYRYVFSLIFFSSFWYFILKNILTKDFSNKTAYLLLACFCGYVVGTSIEITFITSATLAILIITHNLIIKLISRIKKSEILYLEKKFNLNINFYLPVAILFLAIFLFTSSSGFKSVSTDRGILDAFSNLQYIREFTQIFIKKYFIEQSIYWIFHIILLFLTLKYTIKRKESKIVVFPLFLTISILIAMFSLVLCGKTYPDHQNNNTLTFWLMHTEIQPLFTLLLIYPCTIYAGYLSTLLNSKKIIYIILIIITITLFSTRTHNNLTHIYSDEVHPLRQKNIRQYQYEKMIKFYMLKNIKPNIPLVYSQEDFPELDDKIYYSQIEKQLYFNSVVYKMNNIRELGYNLTEDALEQFKKDGGSFSDEELKYPKFGRLFDDTFVLNTKTNVPL